MAAPVSLHLIEKRFVSSHAPVLERVELAVAAESFVAVLGASGSGKSTLLRLIAGLERPTAGRVEIGGQVVTAHDPRCAVVFQEPRLFPWKRVSANVAVGARRMRRKPEVLPWLEAVGLDGLAGRWPHQLSGGQAQRVALARALIGQPQVLLLDEPFAALDALTRLQMQDLLASVCNAERQTVIFVTHDVDEALRLADRVVVLGGRPARVVADVPVGGSRPRPVPAALRERLLAQLGVTRCTEPAPVLAAAG
jgi:ABC-type nitrate/sulfonate/bicarbonate transport system ATPase subunit